MVQSKYDKMLERIRTVSAALDVLGRTDIANLEAAIRNAGQKYRCPAVAANYSEAKFDDLARSAAKNLEEVTSNQAWFRGLMASQITEAERQLKIMRELIAKPIQQDIPRHGERLRNAVAAFKSSALRGGPGATGRS